MNTRSIGTAYCSSCNAKVGCHIEDWGVGVNEFWGVTSTHHDYVAVCNECGEIVIDPEFEEEVL